MASLRLSKMEFMIIICLTVVCGLATLVVNMWVFPVKYQASITLLAIGGNIEENKVTLYESIETGLQIKNDAIKIATAPEILQITQKRLEKEIPGILSVKTETLAECISVDSVENSRIFTINYTDTNPERASLFVNNLGSVLQETVQGYTKIETLKVISPARESINKTSADLIKNVGMALILGCFLSIAAVLIGKFVRK